MTVGGKDLITGTTYTFGEYALTLDDVLSFAERWDPQYFHTDEAAAARGLFGGVIASGIQTIAVMQRLTVDAVYRQWRVIAGRDLREVVFVRPVRPGDVLTGWARIDEVRLDERRGRADVVLTSALTVDGESVLTAVADVVVFA
ncbi:MAG: MaoC/PaaZ C-terminal domain-containing protein [Gordonia sp. (in: high G+C Gram-positive bacteria)]|uniref:MaoC/PaaZ C-terminal domain-containing protein n=1 Tax=Gordonia sp. (in: high G+C Gram-positive bacteria) TaxID=84139 RepID=UPI0039E4E1E5